MQHLLPSNRMLSYQFLCTIKGNYINGKFHRKHRRSFPFHSCPYQSSNYTPQTPFVLRPESFVMQPILGSRFNSCVLAPILRLAKYLIEWSAHTHPHVVKVQFFQDLVSAVHFSSNISAANRWVFSLQLSEVDNSQISLPASSAWACKLASACKHIKICKKHFTTFTLPCVLHF